VSRLELEVNEVDFIANVLGQVPTMTTVQAGMAHLIPKIVKQMQESAQREQQEAALAAAGVEQALS
jgi:hypothetical protein